MVRHTCNSSTTEGKPGELDVQVMVSYAVKFTVSLSYMTN